MYLDMKTLIQCFLIMICVSCTAQDIDDNYKKQTINDLISNLKDSQNKEVIVVAHRGDWRNAPENSLQAIQNCIDMGVDMVEIDVRKTQDGVLVLMHDKTIDRTTNGSGKVNDLTYKALQEFYLVDGLNKNTPHKIPTLKEALKLAKGKILVNLDKSYDIFTECYAIIEQTGTEKQVLIKGGKTRKEVESEFGAYLDKVIFMPIVKLSKPNAEAIVNDYLEHWPPVAFEFVFSSNVAPMINQFDRIKKSGSSVWVNALWPQLNGGNDDEKAALNPKVYNWYTRNKVDIIQTDRPQLLLKFLREKGLHH